MIPIKKVAKERGIDIGSVVKALQSLPKEASSRSMMGDPLIEEAYIEQALALAFEKREQAAAQEKERVEEAEKLKMAVDTLLITSGYEIQGYKIIEYRDFVIAESVSGMGAIKGLAASVSDLAGTESEMLNEKVQATCENAMGKLKKKVADLQCTALIGTAVNMTMFSDSLLGVVVSGTAVVAVSEN